MTKITGHCQNCGDASNPGGAVFTAMKTDWFGIFKNPHDRPLPKTEWVKVCNNCGFPHAFTRRISAKKRALNAFAEQFRDRDESAA